MRSSGRSAKPFLVRLALVAVLPAGWAFGAGSSSILPESRNRRASGDEVFSYVGRELAPESISNRPRSPNTRAKQLMSPFRDAAMRPDQVVAALQLSAGQAVADIGSGPGYFALTFAHAVGPTGRVYGVDIEPHFISELVRRATESGLSNVVPILTSPDDSGLSPSSCDLAFFCGSYRYIEDRVDYLHQLQTRLKSGGRIAIIGWRKNATIRRMNGLSRRVGPPEERKIDPEQVIRELDEAGFKVLERPEFLEYHYFLIASAKG